MVPVSNLTHLQISEILRTLCGESSAVGLPCTLVRLTGCPLRCRFCDTTHAYRGGQSLTLDAVLEQVRALGIGRVLVTGGEPLAQAGCPALLRALLADHREVLLETSGAMDLSLVPAGVHRVVDVKPPSSGEGGRMRLQDLALLGDGDEVKFVVAGRADFDAALEVLRAHDLEGRVALLFAPVHGELEPKILARWLLESGVDARLNLQLHKLAFGPEGDAALAD